jgi:hypothetical protein
VEALWRTLVADTFLGHHPAPAECGEQFLSQISAIVGRETLKARGQREMAASIQPKSWSWKEKLFKLSHLATEKMKTVPWRDLPDDAACWIRLLDREPGDSQYSTSTFLVKYEELLKADKLATNNVQFSSQFIDFRREVNLTVGARRLITTHGKLIGVAPLDSRLGDEVWILAGASTPFVLRPLDSGHRRLIGDAYIHGTMHGEVANSGLNFEDIILS